MRYIIDIESSNLLQNALDYSELPYRMLPDYSIWCIVFRNIDTSEVSTLITKDITKANVKSILNDATEIILHNGIAFDLPVMQLYGVLDYTIGYPDEDSTVFGKPCIITDTLLWSKLLNADRFGGHSLEAWGKRLNNFKGNFNDWSKYSDEMLEYCIQDTSTTLSVYKELIKEQGNHNWSKPYSVELKLADLTLKQELFGFDFDRKKAEDCLVELTKIMTDIAIKVDPILPKKRMTKGAMQEYIPPKIKFKKDGSISAIFQKFLDKHNAVLVDNKTICYEGNNVTLDQDTVLKTETDADIEDIDVVKGYLLSLGWEPSEVKERDLVKNTNKTTKNKTEILESIDRYVAQTEFSLFRELRLDLLGCTFGGLKRTLISKINDAKPIYVPTTPKLTVGVEKEICPNLIKLGEKADFVKDVVHYYTYRHRKNSIAGGALDEDGEPITGFISNIRTDGRIPTPADTLGANTGRYRHKIVCNIPRVTSLYGEEMRSLFGCGKGLVQLGYDFASLEARVMGHYVMRYTDGAALAEALIAEKPNDIHSINARKLGIDRSAAKSFSYAAIYGAQPKKLSKMLGITEGQGNKLFNEYWEAVPALKELKTKLEKYWEATGKQHILGLDGRLLKTRSKHSLVNVLFQSGGAISAKWSAVRLAQDLETKGLLGDPFKHSKKDIKVWWMIHMHDEQQMALHPSLMRVDLYETEEEAKANLTEGCSAIGHGSKGYYVARKTAPVESIEIGIKTACKELKLNVDLGFEYILGLSWSQCH